MPVKARRQKRGMSLAAEVEAWSTLFSTGWDYFDDLGFGGREGTERARARAAEAWLRLGAVFLASGLADEWACGVPWAQREFGDPPCR